jgi:hypothetical protein
MRTVYNFSGEERNNVSDVGVTGICTHMRIVLELSGEERNYVSDVDVTGISCNTMCSNGDG